MPPRKTDRKTASRPRAGKKKNKPQVTNPTNTTPPASGGSRGYAGYEYQLEVSTWIASELMLAKGVADSVTIEPRSNEDIEAAVTMPDTASLALSSGTSGLLIQIKSRSTSPWTLPAFAAVLTGKGETSAGSLARARPVDLLVQDSNQRYLFITNEGLAARLRSFTADSLLQPATATSLPSKAARGLTPQQQKEIARRIAILPGVTAEILASRLRRVLETYGHVPASRHEECIAELKQLIRQRMLGGEDGVLQKQTLVDVLRKHGGSILPTREMDNYVPPNSYERITNQLNEKHAVIIAGPSGTGKTLTANILENKYKKADPPFLVVSGEDGPGVVRDYLSSAHPVLFHLRDPWGTNRLSPNAERWSAELPKLITLARPSHKFLITSRSDVLHSADPQLADRLAPFIVSIEIEDYGTKQLADIYDGIRGGLTGNAASLATQYRKEALARLTRPYEIDRFLWSLTAEVPEKPGKIDDLLRASQIDAIASVVANQILGWDPGGVLAAAIIWAMLKARDALTVETLRGISRILRSVDSALRPDIDGMIDFLGAGRNLRIDGNVVMFYHPRVEDGLRVAIERKRNETEYLLTTLANGLIGSDKAGQDWGVETALGILKLTLEMKSFVFILTPANQKRMDDFLEHRYINAQRVGDFENALEDMARFGSTDHVPSMIARILVRPDDVDDDGFGRFWKAPVISDASREQIGAHPRTQSTIETFIAEILPFSRTHYRDSLIKLLHSFAPHLGSAFREAVKIVAEPNGPAENISVIVEGACRYTTENFDWAIERFLECEDKADQWMKGFRSELRRAEEHELDAAHADHVFDQPQEQYYASETGLTMAVELRHELEGISWLSTHAHRDRLAGYLAGVLRQNDECAPDTLRELLASSNGSNRTSAWSAIEKHWNPVLGGLLAAELPKQDIAERKLRQTLIRVAAYPDGDPAPRIADVLPKMSTARRLEVLRDLLETELPGDASSGTESAKQQNRATAILTSFSGDEGELARAFVEVLSGERLDSVAGRLGEPIKDLLSTALADAPLTILGPLGCLAATAGMDVTRAVDQLLKDDEASYGMEAIQVLVLQPYKASSGQLNSALQHPSYRVRYEALHTLVNLAGVEERSNLAISAKDPSADVRQHWAELMQEKQWPEAVPSLTALLADTRDFDNNPGYLAGPSWSRFSVARSAAYALKEYNSLPKEALDAMVSAVGAQNKDPFARCAAVSALADKDDPRITPLLVRFLTSRGLRSSPEQRPLAQAAAWALVDRAIWGKLRLAEKDVLRSIEDRNSAIAAPVLIAVASANTRLAEELTSALLTHGFPHRADLLFTAAALFHGVVLKGAEKHHETIASVYPREGLTPIDPQFPELSAWSLSLDNDRDVQGYTAWLLSAGLRLPVRNAMSDPRAFDLPKRIGVFSLRSLTPARELDDRPVDDGH
jgi:HEAT repeat protein